MVGNKKRFQETIITKVKTPTLHKLDLLRIQKGLVYRADLIRDILDNEVKDVNIKETAETLLKDNNLSLVDIGIIKDILRNENV